MAFVVYGLALVLGCVLPNDKQQTINNKQSDFSPVNTGGAVFHDETAFRRHFQCRGREQKKVGRRLAVGHLFGAEDPLTKDLAIAAVAERHPEARPMSVDS